MAEYLIQDTTLTAIGDAIRAKEDSSDPIQVSEIAARIAAIETGVTVQRASGTFTTNSRGTASVDCGFKPDAVLIKGNLSGNVPSNLAIMFAEDTRSTTHRGYMWVSDNQSTYQQYKMDITQNASGFSVVAYDHYWYGEDKASNKRSFEYVAVKYTE